MAIVLLNGTKLAPQKIKAPLNQKFIYAVGFMFLVAGHFYLPNSGESGLTLPFNIVVWCAFSIAAAIGCYHLAIKQQVRYSKLTIALFISCVLLTVPLLYSTDSNAIASLPRLTTLWAGWLFFLILQQFMLNNHHKQYLLWFIVIAVLLQATLGYAQYFGVLSQKIPDHSHFTQLPFGIFQHAGVMACFLATGTLLSGYLLARQRVIYGKKGAQIFLLYLTPLLTVPLIVVLAQKIMWLGTATGVLLIILYLHRFSTAHRLNRWFASMICGIGAGIILLSTYNSNALISEQSVTDKITRFTQALDMFIEKPFTGYGYGNFNAEYVLYTARQHQLNSDYPPGISPAESPLNEILYWGTEGGIIPVIGILLAAIMVLLRIYSARKGTRLAILSLFIPIVLHSQIGSPFYYSATHWLVFIVLLFWVDQRTSRYRTSAISKPSKIMLKSVALITPVFTVTYMLLALQANYTLFQYRQSSPENIAILHQVISPALIRKQYDRAQFGHALTYGLAHQKIEPIKQYISWSLNTIKHSPRKEDYTGLIMAYQALGEASKANQIISEANFLFPDHNFSSIAVEPVQLAEQ